MRKPVNVTWEDHPDARIVYIEWDCGCKIHSDEPLRNRICPEHRKEIEQDDLETEASRGEDVKEGGP